MNPLTVQSLTYGFFPDQIRVRLYRVPAAIVSGQHIAHVTSLLINPFFSGIASTDMGYGGGPNDPPYHYHS